MTSVVIPYSAAVAAVMGPMEATVTRDSHARRSSSLNSSAKLRAVDDEVNVTGVDRAAASASRSRASRPRPARVV
jgi:hypothetical protein